MRTASKRAWCGAVLLALTVSNASHALPQHTDKLLHAGASAAVVDVVWFGCALLDQPVWVRIVAGASAGAAVGVGKELADLAGLGTPDASDLLFDAFGIGIGIAIGLVVQTLVDADRAPDAATQNIQPARR